MLLDTNNVFLFSGGGLREGYLGGGYHSLGCYSITHKSYAIQPPPIKGIFGYATLRVQLVQRSFHLFSWTQYITMAILFVVEMKQLFSLERQLRACDVRNVTSSSPDLPDTF